MAGHSKWHNIQARKGRQDKAKSGQFTKVSRLITVAAKEGGADPEMNFSLRLAMEKAKAVNMPKDNIERAIKRGTGELHDGEILEALLYEGFGPGGVAILIDVLTDNRNRSASDIKYIVSKNGGNIGSPGSVQWQFERRGVLRIAQEQLQTIDKEAFQLAIMDAGALDIIEEPEGITIICEVEHLHHVLDVLVPYGLEADSSGLEWLAKESVSLKKEEQEQLEKLLEALDEHDDVREVFTNIN